FVPSRRAAAPRLLRRTAGSSRSFPRFQVREVEVRLAVYIGQAAGREEGGSNTMGPESLPQQRRCSAHCGRWGAALGCNQRQAGAFIFYSAHPERGERWYAARESRKSRRSEENDCHG